MRCRQIAPEPAIRAGMSPRPPRVRGDSTVESAAGPRLHHGGVELALVAIEIDLGARRIGDQRRRPALHRPPDEPVDEPVLQALEPGSREPGGGEQPVGISAAGMRHGDDHRRARLLGPEAAKRRRGVVHLRLHGK